MTAENAGVMPAMNHLSRCSSFDRLIADVYDSDENLHTILVQLGFQQQQIELLLGKHQEQIFSSFLGSVHTTLVGNSKDERLYTILCRRYGLDGRSAETLQSIGQRLGSSRERVRQLVAKALKRCRRTFRYRWETELVSVARELVGLPGHRMPAHQPASRHHAAHVEGGERAADGNVDAAEATRTTERKAAADKVSAKTDRTGEEAGPLVTALRAINNAVPGGLSCYLLAHILAENDGPVVRAVIAHYDLTQYHGLFREIGYERLREIARATTRAAQQQPKSPASPSAPCAGTPPQALVPHGRLARR